MYYTKIKQFIPKKTKTTLTLHSIINKNLNSGKTLIIPIPFPNGALFRGRKTRSRRWKMFRIHGSTAFFHHLPTDLRLKIHKKEKNNHPRTEPGA